MSGAIPILKDNTLGYTDFHKEIPSVETGLDKPEVVKESYVVDCARATLAVLVKNVFVVLFPSGLSKRQDAAWDIYGERSQC